MSLTRKLTFAVALAAPLLFLAPPKAEAQSVRFRAFRPFGGQRYSGETRYYYGPRNQVRGYAPRYYGGPRYYGPYRGYDRTYRGYGRQYRGRYDRPYGRYNYYTPSPYYRGGSLWFGF